MFTIAPINPFTASRFSGLTFAAYRDTLAAASPGVPLIGVGATTDEGPVGLALARRIDETRARLVSIYVLPTYRRRGLGAQLLGDLQKSLETSGVRAVEARYAAEADGVAAVDGLLRKCGWPEARDYLHTLMTDGRIMSAPWFEHAVLPAAFDIAPWSTVTGGEREALAAASAEGGWIPRLLAPLDYAGHLDAATSLVLRRDGEIAGWALTHPIDATMVHYANVYVRPSVNRAGRTFAALALVAEAVRRQARARGIASRGRFEVVGTNTAFLRFIDRHLGEYLIERAVRQRAVKRLA